MKARQLILTLLLALAVPAMAAQGHAHRPKHGGVHVEVKEIDYELVARPDVIQLYVSDHDKAIDYAKATARVTLLVGTEKQEVKLEPAGNRFEARGSFKLGPGAKAVAQVTVNGKASTARFALK